MLGAPQVGLMLKGRHRSLLFRPFRALYIAFATQGSGCFAAFTLGWYIPPFQGWIARLVN